MTARVSQAVDAPVHGRRPAGLSPQQRGGDGAVDLTPVGWTPDVAMNVKHWITYGKRFARLGSASHWWIGDWMRYGNARYGEKCGAASKATGYDRQTLMNMAYVASRFSTERRRECASWSHHAELAALPAAQQDVWLDLTEQERLTVRSLREAVRRGLTEDGKPHRRVADPSGKADESAFVCPHCGRPIERATPFRPQPS